MKVRRSKLTKFVGAKV